MNYNSYLQSEHWEKARKYVLDNNSVCEFCGNKYNLNVHHKTYANIGDEEVDDLIVLCKRCHGFVHTTNNINTDNLVFMPNDLREELGLFHRNEIAMLLSIYNGINKRRELRLSDLQFIDHIRSHRKKEHLMKLKDSLNIFESFNLDGNYLEVVYKDDFIFRTHKKGFIILDIEKAISIKNKYELLLYMMSLSVLRGDKGVISMKLDTFKRILGVENNSNEYVFVHRFLYKPLESINSNKSLGIKLVNEKRHGNIVLKVYKLKQLLR